MPVSSCSMLSCCSMGFSGTRPVVPMHAEEVFTAAVLPVLEQLYLCKWARPRDVSKHVGRTISQYWIRGTSYSTHTRSAITTCAKVMAAIAAVAWKR